MSSRFEDVALECLADLGIEGQLIELLQDEPLDASVLPEDLRSRVTSGELSLEEAVAIMTGRANDTP